MWLFFNKACCMADIYLFRWFNSPFASINEQTLSKFLLLCHQLWLWALSINLNLQFFFFKINRKDSFIILLCAYIFSPAKQYSANSPQQTQDISHHHETPIKIINHQHTLQVDIFSITLYVAGAAVVADVFSQWYQHSRRSVQLLVN